MKARNLRTLFAVALSGLICSVFTYKSIHAQVLELPPGSGNLVRLSRLAPPADDPNSNFRLSSVVPPEDQAGIVAGFRSAFSIRKTNSAIGLYLLHHNSGACGEASDRLVEQMRLDLPEKWKAQQIRSVVGSEFQASVHQTTLLTSPSGNYYAIDVSMGYVQIVRMLPNGSGWEYYPGEQAYFSPYIANALALQGAGNLSWIPSDDRVPVQARCKLPQAEKKKLVKGVRSRDPNDKIGSTGAGLPQFISGQEPLRYSIFFENIETATAAAQDVVITDQLDASKVDLSTLGLGPIAFGNKMVVPPLPGMTSYNTDVDLRPAKNLIVRINAQLDKNTGLLTWRFSSIDPATGQPTTDPLAGFLPPDKNAPEGDGSVMFTILPKADLPTGTEIRNQARIVFDTNAPIDTPQWLNTIDNSLPASQVMPLGAMQSSIIFDVNWTGTDTGSGIQSYDVFVSENSGPFTLWQSNTSATSRPFVGQPGKSYAFYTESRDGAGNLEPAKTTGEAITSMPSNITNAIDDTGFFVRQHYLDFLGREPDPPGFAGWVNTIKNCASGDTSCDRVHVSGAFYQSAEFQQRGYFVYRFYPVSFGRKPDHAEFVPDLASVSGFLDATQLEAAKAAFIAAFIARPAFVTKYNSLSNTAYVDTLLQTAGVTLSSRQSMIDRLNNATLTRAAVLRQIVESAEVSTRYFNQAFVVMEYFGYLRRDPDALYLNWIQVLDANPADSRHMVTGFVNSAEYRQRFGP